MDPAVHKWHSIIGGFSSEKDCKTFYVPNPLLPIPHLPENSWVIKTIYIFCSNIQDYLDVLFHRQFFGITMQSEYE